MHESWVAILGWRDEPTDAVLEYCEYLREALGQQGVSLELCRVRWPELGWGKALRELRDKVRHSKNTWFILQYTALTWSRRGFSLRALRVIRVLKKSDARCAIMFHDSEGYPGNRIVDRIRRSVQIYTMRKALQLVDLAILNVPPKNTPWVPEGCRNTVFIPVGANLPLPERASPQTREPGKQPPAVVVFSLSEGRSREEEVRTIGEAAAYAAERLGTLRLVVLGRNSESGGLLLKEKLAGTSVQLIVHGMLAGQDVVRVLKSCDVMLFVRGPISSRRGSAIAGIACGLPVVAREGWETGWPITEAGVMLLPADEAGGYGLAVFNVLSDKAYAASLAERSRKAYERYFSWTAIAAQYLEDLRKASSDG
jgi:glycosyltransferase involved in cell wall biosynthesis